jgi:hypothetical protein
MAHRRIRALSAPAAASLFLATLALISGPAGIGPGGVAAAAPASPVPEAHAQPTISAATKLALRRYVAAGTRAYVVGVENGSFPPIGWHITGQMGGVWAPPIKLLDGLWFGISGSWLDNATRYTSGPGFVRLTFPTTDGVRPTLTEFSPDGTPAVLFGLTLQPTGGSATRVPLVAQAHSQVIAAYPWSSTNPTWQQVEHPDTAVRQGAHIQFHQTDTDYYAEVGSTVTPTVSTGKPYWGPTPPSDRAVFGPDGAGGQLSWNLPVPAAGRTLWVAVAGSQTGSADAAAALGQSLRDPVQLLVTKVAQSDAAAGLTDVSTPDAGVNRALLWSKLDLVALRRTVTNLQIRYVNAGKSYPAKPITTVPQLSGIDAAYPDYAEFFGTDGAYSTYGLVTSGQWQTAMDQLNAMRIVSRIVNGKTGKVVHEVNSTGAVYYGANTDPGDVNETAQFAIAAGLVWQWSGDQSVLRDNYSFINAGEHYLASLDPNPADLWPQGDGIVEDPYLGIEAVDVASETVNALGVLHDMAVAMGDHTTAQWAAARGQDMLASFGQWWIASQSLFADSLCDHARVGDCSHYGQKLQQRYWTSVAPMEQDIASPARGRAALSRIETPTFTGSCGLYVDGVGGPEGTNGQTCYLVNTGALAVAQANYGQLSQAVINMDKVASQLTVEMPGSLPELAKSANYNPYEAFTSRANVMQAWSSYGLLWTTVHDLFGVTPDVPAGAVSVIPAVPPNWHQMAVRTLRVGDNDMAVTVGHTSSGYTVDVAGAQGLHLTIGTVVPAGAAVRSVTLNGQPVSYRTVATTRGKQVEVGVAKPGAVESLAVTAR